VTRDPASHLETGERNAAAGVDRADRPNWAEIRAKSQCYHPR
jgi:hypothetical protein